MYELGKDISYDDSFLDDVLLLLLNYQELGVTKKTILLEEQQDFLRKIIPYYLGLKLDRNYIEIEPKKMKPKEVVTIADSILISLFPNFYKKIKEYNDLIYLYEDFIYSESCLNYSVDNKKAVLGTIDVSENFNSYTVGIINHEKTHALMFEYLKLKRYPSIYMELFPVLIQKISNTILEQEYFIPDVTIIDLIVRTVDNIQHINILDSLKDITLEEQLSNLLAYQYLNLKANEYLIADWYSDLLLYYYIIDKTKMISRLNELFKGNITVSKFLNYYNISMQRKDLMSTITNKLDTAKKYSIKI